MTDRVRKFAVGDIVVVCGPPGEVIGEVLDASAPDEMPDLGPGSCSKEAKDAMREQHVDLILLIGHRHDDQQVCFFAIHNSDGWTDLHGQKLTVLKGYAVELPPPTEARLRPTTPVRSRRVAFCASGRGRTCIRIAAAR